MTSTKDLRETERDRGREREREEEEEEEEEENERLALEIRRIGRQFGMGRRQHLSN